MNIDDRIPNSLAVLQVMRKGRLDRHDICMIMSEVGDTAPTQLDLALESLRRAIDEALGATKMLNWLDAKLARFF